MKEFYLKPISNKRFEEYLAKLQGGTKGDLILPISGFNPMAKGHIIEKIEELEAIGAEHIIENVIEEINLNKEGSKETKFEVVLNLADDYKGGWTNHYSTDFDSKFKINALISRNFCTPYFWTSENYTEQLIKLRTKEYLNRTLYWLNGSKPKTLENHLEQEIYAIKNSIDETYSENDSNFNVIANYYTENQKSEEYHLIFNFLYGDIACENLGYNQYGLEDRAGLKYAKHIALKRKTTA